MRELFARPLILGASISANFVRKGPADRALERLGGQPRPVRLAGNGMTARRLSRRLDREAVAKASVVIAIDYLFWDASVPNLAKSLAALRKLVSLTEEEGVPLFLATIPKVTFKLWQWNREAINEALRAEAKAHPHVILIDLDQMNREITRKGSFRIGRERFAPDQIAPDGIHLSSAASEYVALEILRRAQGLEA